jgi:hypothetical protein
MGRKIISTVVFLLSLSGSNSVLGYPLSDYPEFMSYSLSLIPIVVRVIKNGTEVPLDQVEIGINNRVYSGSDFDQNRKEFPPFEIEGGYYRFTVKHQDKIISNEIRLAPIMVRSKTPDNIDFLNKGDYQYFNVVRITFDLDSVKK